ncbi:hypothetical protein F5X98DRAFT_350459 [Xylaria grammica]|nr:hypothetical protein F5X98DRAFT_350459 [Xylaria grammica]
MNQSYRHRHYSRGSDKPELPHMDTMKPVQPQLRTATIPENVPDACSVPNGQWLWRAKTPNVANMNHVTSLESDIPWTWSRLGRSPYSGSLVCPPTVLMPLGNVFGDRYIGNANAVYPGNTEAQEANRAPTQWYEHTSVLESLVSTRCFICT